MGSDELKPGFFIVGAPRCGTSALSRYLSKHPEICFSKPKEPHFFSRPSLDIDKADLQSQYIEPFFADYDARRHRLLGEGSVSYLYSPHAIENILKINPEAKFIVTVRNPIDLVQSYHARLLYTLDETEKDFAKAWALQADRAAGRHIPETCRDSRLLQYRQIGMLGHNVQQLIRTAKNRKIRFFFFEDFEKSPKWVYQQALKFLELEYDGRISFRRIRENSGYRSSLVQQALLRPPRSALAVLGLLAWTTGTRRQTKRLRKAVMRINSVAVARPRLDDGMKEVLVETFAEDIELLSRWLQRDLSHWTELHSSGS